jgi:tRNA-dihydrouridine synthase B
MKIGNLDIGKKLILAPMAEISDSSFRKITKEFGTGLTFTQMVSASGVINNNFDTLRYLSFSRDEKPIGVQILGNDPGIISEAISEIRKFKPDLIDINCGCSVDKVLRSDMGSSLLNNPAVLAQIIRRGALAAGDIPLSVKLRLGRDRKNINIIENAKIAEDNGASLITVHCRTSADSYETEPDWSWLKKVKENTKIGLVGNGSVFTPADAAKMIEQTGCDSVMVGRGAIGNPFIFQRFNSLVENNTDPGHPKIEEAKRVLLKQIDLLKKEFGEDISLNRAKKHAIWYLQFYNGINLFLNKIFPIKSIEDLNILILEHCENINNGFYPETKTEEIYQKFKKRILFWLEEEDEKLVATFSK